MVRAPRKGPWTWSLTCRVKVGVLWWAQCDIWMDQRGPGAQAHAWPPHASSASWESRSASASPLVMISLVTSPWSPEEQFLPMTSLSPTSSKSEERSEETQPQGKPRAAPHGGTELIAMVMLLGAERRQAGRQGDTQNRAGGCTWQRGTMPHMEPGLIRVQWVGQGASGSGPAAAAAAAEHLTLAETCCAQIRSSTWPHCEDDSREAGRQGDPHAAGVRSEGPFLLYVAPPPPGVGVRGGDHTCPLSP